MRPSTLTVTAVPRQLTLAQRIGQAGYRTDHAPAASALRRYEQSQSGFAVIPASARHAILEIGDRMQGLRGALRPIEPGRDEHLAAGDPAESLIASALRDAVDPCLGALGREIGFAAPARWRVASRYFHERFGSLVDLSPLAARCFHKPLGYAGDFEMMNMVYRDQSLGGTLFGRSLSRVVLDSEAGRAVRHRARYLAEKIEAAVAHGRPRPARILSVAAGPAMELQLILRTDPALLAAGRTEIALLDQDAGALEHARERIGALAAQARVEVAVRCINTSIRTVIAEGLDDSYDLVYSAGLFDYLKDRPVRAAGARLVAALAPGGTAVIGNFDVANPTRPFMELILDWPLHHRSADDLRLLFGELGTGLTIEREATGVNLFAVIGA
jgi:extracellular factor (EF) 3-hydroxypalmitic acid methyl ester biosynthesis protein